MIPTTSFLRCSLALACLASVAGAPASADESGMAFMSYPSFSIGRVSSGLREFSRVVYGYKAEFLTGLAGALDGLGPIESPFSRSLGPVTAARLLALEVAETVASDARSEYVEKSVLPPIQGSIQALRSKYGIPSLQGIPASKESLGIALTSVSLAYKAVRPYVASEAGIRLIAEARKASGISLAKVQAGDWSCGEYLRFAEGVEASGFVEQLLQNPRTRGFGKLISLMGGYLRGPGGNGR